MEDQRIGAILRAVRIRRGYRQSDVANLAFVSDVTVSRVERGHLDTLSLRALRRIAAVLEVRLDVSPWSRRGDLHRFATAEHAALVESVIRELVAFGWEARAEVSFNERGERGFIDILAWHATSRTLLVIEVKTEIVDVGELLGTLDRKRRLAANVARPLDWDPAAIACALIVRESKTNRRRVAEHEATIRSLLPADGRRLRAFLHHPTAAIAAVAFWSDRHPGTLGQVHAGVRRVRRRGKSTRPA